MPCEENWVEEFETPLSVIPAEAEAGVTIQGTFYEPTQVQEMNEMRIAEG